MTQTAEHYGVIIIGAGLAGLSCAALLARAGRRVVVLDKNNRPGGYAVCYTVKGHRFDIAVQAIGGCGAEGPVFKLLQDLHIENSVRFLPCEPARAYYTTDNDEPWRQPGAWQVIVHDVCERFPDFSESIKTCYRIWSGILRELTTLAGHGAAGAAFEFSRCCPLLARYGSYTVQEFLDEQGLPGELQKLLAARAGYCMLPPQRLSVVGFACTEMTYGDGAWLIEGGIQRLCEILAGAIQASGGSVELKTRASGIITENGGIKAVQAADGSVYKGACVVVASAVGPAFEQLLDNPELLPGRYKKKLAAMEQTGSYYIAYYSVPAEAVEGLPPNSEIEQNLGPVFETWSPDVYYMLIPSLVDLSAAPAGFHCLCLSLPCPAGYILGAEGKLRCRSMLEQAVSSRFPQLKDKLTRLFELGPQQLASMSCNPAGAAYGWAHIPEQSGVKRLAIKTPVPGLYLAGHWTMPGGGIAGVITSGRLCAQAILKDRA
jgi:phytoene dehydrogenase-like protein